MSERDAFKVFMEALARYCLTSPLPRSSDAETTEAMQQGALPGAAPRGLKHGIKISWLWPRR